MPYKDPEKERACGRRRYERITAERTASGMCPRCGKAKAAGRLYGGKDAERCRAFARDRSRRRDRARRDARTCTRCGTNPPVEGGNHARPNDITEGYAADWTIGQLREPAQGIADRIDALMNATAAAVPSNSP